METYLAHHGILGMKWGVRRYQNEDGTLTTAGKRRYLKEHVNRHGRLTEKGKAKYADIVRQKRDNEQYKRDAYNGVIDDPELVELLQREASLIRDAESKLYANDPEAKSVIDKAMTINYSKDEGKPYYMDLDDIDEIIKLGKEDRQIIKNQARFNKLLASKIYAADKGSINIGRSVAEKVLARREQELLATIAYMSLYKK